MGRPIEIDKDTTDAICAHLKQGKPLYASAAQCGVARSTIKGWLRAGNEAIAKVEEGYTLEGNDLLYAEFATEVQLARDYGEGWLVDQIIDAAGGEKAHLKKWQAYMTILERTRPDEWRRRASAEYVDREKPAASRLDVSKLDASERAAFRSLLAKASGGE